MRTKTLTAAVALTAAAGLTLTACGGGGGSADGKSNGVADVSGGQQNNQPTVIDPPFPKPDVTLTDTHGKPFNLRKETLGKPTLVYFGYDMCPDICPATVSNIAIARKSLPKAEQQDLQVVFIDTDPQNETPAQLGKWLAAAGDPLFIGLVGDFKKTQAAAKSIGISLEPPVKQKDGTIVSTHGAQVLAFSPKNNGGYVLFDELAPSQEYAKALPKIMKGEKP